MSQWPDFKGRMPCGNEHDEDDDCPACDEVLEQEALDLLDNQIKDTQNDDETL